MKTLLGFGVCFPVPVACGDRRENFLQPPVISVVPCRRRIELRRPQSQRVKSFNREFLERSRRFTLQSRKRFCLECTVSSNEHEYFKHLERDIEKAYSSAAAESEYWFTHVEGKIPHELYGTFFRNGPALFEVGGVHVNHPFDGDGMIVSIAFKDGRAFLRNRFVQTEEYQREQAAGKRLYRNVFGTQRSGGWINNMFDVRQKNLANTNVIFWGKRLLALWEASQPYRMDPTNLRTLGLDLLDGILRKGNIFGTGLERIDGLVGSGTGASAHMHIEHSSNRLLAFNSQITPGGTDMTVVEFDDSFRAVKTVPFHVPGLGFFHDFAFTPNWYIFLQSALRIDPIPLLLGLKGAGQCIGFDYTKPSTIWLVPRTPIAKKPISLAVDPCFVFHFLNAFESADGDEVTFDAARMPDFPSVLLQGGHHWLSPPDCRLWRWNATGLTSSIPSSTNHQILPNTVEFPAVNPEYWGTRHRWGYVCGFDTGEQRTPKILKIDVDNLSYQEWAPGPRGYVGEPLFVPRPTRAAEDDGWILTLVYDGEEDKTDLCILDAAHISAGPLAKLRLRDHIPPGLHGSFTPHFFGPESSLPLPLSPSVSVQAAADVPAGPSPMASLRQRILSGIVSMLSSKS